MLDTRISVGRTLILASALCGLYGCSAEAQPRSHRAALQGAAGSASDTDRDVDERSDEAYDLDDDVDERTDEPDDFDLQFSELPEAVQATAQAEIGTGTIVGIDRDREPAGIEYEIEFTRDGVEYEVSIAEDGTKLRSKRD